MSRMAISLVVIVAACVAFMVAQRGGALRLTAQLGEKERALVVERDANTELREQLARAQQERDKFQKDAAEVHRLRGEISNLRNANKALEQQAAQGQKRVANAQTPAQPAAESAQFTVPSFSNYTEMGRFVAGLRSKAFGGGPLTAEERQYLQTVKPELEKLERSPADFANFQAELIQSAAGITEPEKIEKIRQTIQRVYEGAVNRGLDINSRRVDDPQWVDARFQLDRRGTQAVQSMMSPEERAAFDRQFLGIMGVDLGTGVDKTLYPKNFFGEPGAEP